MFLAATRVQAAWRRWRGALLLRYVHALRDRAAVAVVRDAAARTIQRVFRATQTVRKARLERKKGQDLSLKRLVFTDNHAARTIQRLWRGGGGVPGYHERECARVLRLACEMIEQAPTSSGGRLRLPCLTTAPHLPA